MKPIILIAAAIAAALPLAGCFGGGSSTPPPIVTLPPGPGPGNCEGYCPPPDARLAYRRRW